MCTGQAPWVKREHAAASSTGRQNSSKAGFTKVVYWVRICSRSRPRCTSRRTAVVTGCAQPSAGWWPTPPGRPARAHRLTPPRQPDVRVRVHEEAQVEHVQDVLAVEHQDTLKQHHIRGVHHCGLWQPAREILVPRCQHQMGAVEGTSTKPPAAGPTVTARLP